MPLYNEIETQYDKWYFINLSVTKYTMIVNKNIVLLLLWRGELFTMFLNLLFDPFCNLRLLLPLFEYIYILCLVYIYSKSLQ